MLLGFKRQFAPFVEEGSKTHSVRSDRKIAPRIGETCHCYVDPRQKTMRLLGRFPCTGIDRIKIEAARHPDRLVIRINGQALSNDEAEAFLWRDGFRDRTGETFPAMAQARRFWVNRLPHEGPLIHWRFDK